MDANRYRTYRRLRRQHGMSARTAAWLTSAPRYDVPPDYVGHQYPFQPEAWRAAVLAPDVRPYPGFTVDPIEVDGETYVVAYVPDDEPYEWGDMEPTDEDRESIEPFGVCVVRVRDGEHDELWGCERDNRLPSGADDRYLREVACDLIDELRRKPVANPGVLLLPLGVTA